MQDIRSRLTCGITFNLPASPAELPCGHVFEMSAIMQWYITTSNRAGTSSCPICRVQFSRDDIRLSMLALYIINSLPVSTSISTQTDISMDDIIAEEDFITAPPPALNNDNNVVRDVETHSFDTHTLSDDESEDDFVPHINIGTYGQSTNEYDALQATPGTRIISYVYPFNLQSTNTFLATEVRERNKTFLVAIFGGQYTNYLLPIKRYMYQHSSTDISIVARHLAVNGYFVFDLFVHSIRRGVNNYIIMTTPYLITKTFHRLCEFTRS